MQTYKNDINWWIREAHNDSHTATEIIEELGQRIVIVQEENEMLKAENIALKRAGNAKNLDELQKLKATISDLTDWLKEEGLNKKTIACITSGGKGLQMPYASLAATDLQLQLTDTHYPISIFATYRHASLLILTSAFRLFQRYSFAIPYRDTPHANSLQPWAGLNLTEEKIAVIRVEEALKDKPFVILVTSRGFTKRFLRKTFLDFLNTNQPIVTGSKEDRPVQLVMASGKNLLLVTKNGFWIKFSPANIPVEGIGSLTLEQTDEVIGAVEVDDNANIFFVEANGSIVAIQGSALANTKKAGEKGRRLPKNICPITCFAGKRSPHLIWLTKQGKIGMTNLKAIPIAEKLQDAKPINLIQQELLACSVVLPEL